MFLHGWSWGSAALHPRLYAVTRSAGFANVFAWLVLGFRCAPPQALRCHPLRGFCQCFCMAGPGVPLRSTPGFTLSPAPRVLPMFLHGWSWGSAALHPRLYAVTRSAGFANVFAWMGPGVSLRSTPGFTLSPRSAGFANVFAWMVPGVSLRSTLGFTLSPAPRALQMLFAWLVLGFRCAPPQ